MDVIYNGYYGYKNSGDDSFCEVATWAMNKIVADSKHTIIADTPLHLEGAASFVKMGGWLSGNVGTICKIMTSNLFLCAGGSTLHSVITKHDPRFYSMQRKKLGGSFKSIAVGLSLGPYRSAQAERSCIEYLKTLDFLALRDSRSYEMAKSYNLNCNPVLASDLALLLPEIYGKIDPYSKHHNQIYNDNLEKPRACIGISYCNYETYIGSDTKAERARYNSIISLINELKTENLFFRFFIFNGHPVYGDELITRKLIAELELKEGVDFDLVPYIGSVREIYNAINACQAIISTRLHASIFSAAGETPFFLVEYHRKCTDFLDDIGQDPVFRIPDGQFDIEGVKNSILKVVFGVQNFNLSNFDVCRRRAMKNFSFRQVLL